MWLAGTGQTNGIGYPKGNGIRGIMPYGSPLQTKVHTMKTNSNTRLLNAAAVEAAIGGGNNGVSVTPGSGPDLKVLPSGEGNGDSNNGVAMVPTGDATQAPAPETVEATDGASEARGFLPMTPDAYYWVRDRRSIPGSGGAPIEYCGPRILGTLADLLGRPLTLEEVQLLVVSDGDYTRCTVALEPGTDRPVEFQPVRYVAPFLVRDVVETINAQEGDKTLIGVPMDFRGQFYAKDGELLPVSGKVYQFFNRKLSGPARFDENSALVIAAYSRRTKSGHPLWGVTAKRAGIIIADQEARRLEAERARVELQERVQATVGGGRNREFVKSQVRKAEYREREGKGRGDGGYRGPRRSDRQNKED